MVPEYEEIAKLLIKEELLTNKQYERILEKIKESNESFEKVVVKMGYISQKDLTMVIGKKMGVAFADLDEIEIDSELARTIPEHLAQRYKVIPVDQKDNVLKLAMMDPLNVLAIDDIRLITGYSIKPMIATETAIMKSINNLYGVTDLVEVQETVKDLAETDFGSLEIEESMEEEISLDKLKEMVDEAPIVRVVNLIISQAINDGASDIHIEPAPNNVRVRYRVDGVLHDVMTPPRHIQAPMVSRIKIMANMDIAERRVPQDGKIHLKHDYREFDLRVSSCPTIFGEKIVMRILDKSSVMLGLNKLGFLPHNLKVFEGIVEKPYGMILVTGPTGSGKSTTLYSCLNKLNTDSVNIMTIEDPCEYTLPGINQIQVNEKAGLTFANALRSFLRQDPDIMMVGEIRDGETAKIAIEAALTGHLVLSTLHTNDAAGAVTRLIEMGIEPFLCASSVIGVLAQRLGRTICPNCKETYQPPPDAIAKYGLQKFTENGEVTLYRGRGCELCKLTGFKGRMGIHEVLAMTDSVRNLILQSASSAQIKSAAIHEGMKTMTDDGMLKVLSGSTSIEECLRVVFIEGEVDSEVKKAEGGL